jgi:CheY-like chemotaxis protein
VVECSTIDEALRACKRARFDGVLTDHHLADQNGPAFMAQLRAAGVRCPVVVVTGSSNPEVHARAYAAGASRVFFGSEMDFTGYFRRKFQAGT